MKRVLHIIILVALGVSMSKCKCQSKGPYIASYEIGVINKSDTKITKFESHLSFYDYMLFDKAPTTKERITVSLVGTEDEIFSFRMQFDNSTVIESTIPLKALPDRNGPSINVDIIIEPDFTLTIKQYEIANSNTDERRLTFQLVNYAQ